MIFEYIMFQNYRLYYGKQILQFRDKNQSTSDVLRKNVVLVGGLNGHGKTSLIDAIYISLFGHRRFKNRKEYGEYISNCVNHKHVNNGGKQASIELAFTDETGSYAIEVNYVYGKHEENSRKLYKLDNQLKKEHEIQLSEEEFNDFIDNRIPLDVAQFFIFDAEKIRDLVGDQDKDETIHAIQKVVSLELYNQLLEDIDKIYYAMTREIKSKTSNQEIDVLFEKLEAVSNEIDELESRSKKVDDKIVNLRNEVQLKEQERRKLIAHNSSTKQKINKRIGEYEQKLETIEKELKKAKSIQLQKLILQPYIQKLKIRIREERKYLDAKLREDAKFDSYEKFINTLLNTHINPALTTKQKAQLKENGKRVWAKMNRIQQDTLSKQMDILHELSQDDYQKLLGFPEAKETNLKELINDKQGTEKLLAINKSKLESAPEAIDTSELDETINQLNQELGELAGQKKVNIAKTNRLKESRFNLNREIKAKQKHLLEQGPLEEKLELLEKIRNGTKDFICEVTELKARQLKGQIETILNQLFRKGDLQRVEFHPEKFTLTIYDQYNRPIDLLSRSEGEKQMIALAMIWALTKVSGSKFPFVIDTPLARLDSIHRSNLVNHYFTKLSEQVVILSTDTEITEDFYQELKPFITKTYTLQFDEEEHCTNIKEGYFFYEGGLSWQM